MKDIEFQNNMNYLSKNFEYNANDIIHVLVVKLFKISHEVNLYFKDSFKPTFK